MNELRKIVNGYLGEKFILVDLTANQRSGYIRITIDSEDTVTLDDTSSLTKAILEAGEIDPLYPSGFRLEITSPGIDYPLSFPFQYKKNINRSLTVRLTDDGKEKSLVGKMLSADDLGIEILNNEGKISVQYDQIISANVNVSFK